MENLKPLKKNILAVNNRQHINKAKKPRGALAFRGSIIGGFVNKEQSIKNKNYRDLIISIAVFLSLVVLLLAVTFYTSHLLERSTALTNETNRLTSAAQEVIKDLFDLKDSYGEDMRSPHIQTVLERLESNSKLIDERLPVLRSGGVVPTQAGDVRLTGASSALATQNLDIIESQWQLLNPRIQNYLKDAQNIEVDSYDALFLAATQARTSSLNMVDAFQNLVTETTIGASRQATTIRAIQIVGVAAVLLYFLIFIFFIVRRLRSVDAQVVAAQRETQEIMETVNTGLFLLDKDLKVGNQYSAALEGIMGTNRLAGEKLSTILRNRISDSDLQTAEEFVDQLYNPRVKAKLVDSLNPLNKIMLHDGTGADENRYLDFRFSRVYEDKEIARILVSVNDVTDVVRLEHRLEKERAQNDRQIEMLTTILNVSPRTINEFIAGTHMRIEKMNDILKNPGSSQFELEGKLKAIYREMHSLKGESSALKLHSFTKIASEAEDKLHALQNQGKLSGNDFLPLIVHLDELLNLANTIQDLGERINASQAASAAGMQTQDATSQAATAPTPASKAEPLDAKAEFGEYLVQFAADIAERQGKRIEVDISRMAGVRIPKDLSVPVKEVCIQLLRNAIVHGIADSQTRVQSGKEPVGKITIYFAENAGANHDHFLFAVEDDGQGIDYEAIRERLINSGKYSADKVLQFNQTQLLNTLFSSGFSTKDEADEDGGRGVGLDIVKERVKEYGGKINVQTEKGKFSRFVIKLPM